MSRQDPSDEYGWTRGTNTTIHQEDEVDGEKRHVEFVPDLALCDDKDRPFIIVEVSFSQSPADIHRKASARLKAIPSLQGVIVILLEERPGYRAPSQAATNEDDIDDDEWKASVSQSPQYGPILFHQHRWIGVIASCTVEIFLKNDPNDAAISEACGFH